MKTEQRIFIPGQDGQIEAVISQGTTDRLAIICHPHPLFSGTMDNKVVTTVARLFHSLGMTSVRFNFRGVGKSEGTFDYGNGEQEDLKAVIQYCQQHYPYKELVLAGFSFGSFVSYEVARDIQPDLLISIAPPAGNFTFGEKLPAQQWIVVYSDDDDVVPIPEVKKWLAEFNPQPEIIQFTNAGHFFHGQLTTLRDKLTPLITRVLP